jgi:anti-sigma-K factor RskA
MSPSLGEAVLVADGLAAPPHGHTYELWVIDDTSPKPAGTFEPGDSAALSRVVEGSMEGAKVIAVTVEPDGGRPTPSGDPVATFTLPSA